MTRLGILLSGRGSNFESIAHAIDSGEIAAEIAIVLSNREQAPGLEIARRRGLKAAAIRVQGRSRTDYDDALAEILQQERIDLICLAGYMRLLGPEFVSKFRGRILNIHPSLLPSFPGLHAQRQALERGVKISGCTVHYVTEDMDAGPIILQAAVPVEPDDTEESLSARVLREEHRIYPAAIRIAIATLSPQG